MARLIEIGQHELNPTIRVLSDAGATTDHAAWIRKPDNAVLVVAFLNEQMELANKNPFELSVEETIKRFREMSKQEGWKIGDEVFETLTKTAPEWPKGRLAFRSLRIRFGEGDAGVAQTFEAHAAAIRRTFNPKFWRWELLLSGKHPYQGKNVERLRLLGDKNVTHKPVIEWVTFDLDANRQRKSITAVRGPKSLADEGLAFAWLFREYPPAIDYDKTPAFFLGGYELNAPGRDGESWQRVPCVSRYTGEVFLHASWHSCDRADYSVPDLRE